MGLRWKNLLVCSINMRGGARSAHMPTRHHVKTLAVTSFSRSNPETLFVWEVLAHPYAAFHPCMCGLCGGTAMIVATLIGYDDMEVAAGTTTRRRRSWSTISSTPTCNYVGSLLQLFFHYTACLVVTIHDLLLASIFGWHGKSSVSVAYPYPYNSIRVIFLVWILRYSDMWWL
jgi:hypothetical protein